MIINESIALFMIGQKIISMPKGQEISANTMHEILKILRDTLGNVERITFWRIEGDSCQIIAGIPLDKHGIGKKYELKEHPDIEFAVNSPKHFNLIENPAVNSLTDYDHFRDAIKENEVNAILYIVTEDKTGVIVVDATGQRQTFALGDAKLCEKLARLIAARLVSYEEFAMLLVQMIQDIPIQQFRDQIINRVVPLDGYVKRLKKNVRRAKEHPEQLGKDAKNELDQAEAAVDVIDKEFARMEQLALHIQ